MEIRRPTRSTTRTQRAVCVEALKIVQQHRGWVSDESIADVAEALQMTPAELEGVATFYNIIFRKPVGRHVILLCDSVSCWIMGCERLREHLQCTIGYRAGRYDCGWPLHPAAECMPRRLRPCAGDDDRQRALSGPGSCQVDEILRSIRNIGKKKRKKKRAC